MSFARQSPNSLRFLILLAHWYRVLHYKVLTHVTHSFYEWRSPHHTMLSLSFLGLVGLCITTTPLWLLVKMIQLEAAFIFFGTFPIASRMPQYRHIVSPLTWLFWKIPTDGTCSKFPRFGTLIPDVDALVCSRMGHSSLASGGSSQQRRDAPKAHQNRWKRIRQGRNVFENQ